jgi:XTP/dITP diphosphohydrolase
MKQKILVATTNPGKIAEIKVMLDADIEWVGLSDFANIGEIKEDGSTFAENARKKATGYAKATGLWTLADDSGLVVDALGGKPGVKSARFSLPPRLASRDAEAGGEKPESENRTLIDHRNIAKVLKLLASVPKEKRTARFVCCLCLACPPLGVPRTEPVEGASPDKILIETQGTLEGLITEKEIGENGFGYDPIFFVPHLNKTVGQLAAEEKNAISHRGNAIRKLKPLLEQLLNPANKWQG